MILLKAETPAQGQGEHPEQGGVQDPDESSASEAELKHLKAEATKSKLAADQQAQKVDRLKQELTAASSAQQAKEMASQGILTTRMT